MRVINRYIRDIKSCLPVVSKSEKNYLEILKSSLIHYKNNNPSFTYNDLIEEFGYPKDIAASYINEQSNGYVLKHIKVKNTIKYTCLILISIALLVGLWKAFLVYSDYKKSIESKITHIETTQVEVTNREKID